MQGEAVVPVASAALAMCKRAEQDCLRQQEWRQQQQQQQQEEAGGPNGVEKPPPSPPSRSFVSFEHYGPSSVASIAAGRSPAEGSDRDDFGGVSDDGRSVIFDVPAQFQEHFKTIELYGRDDAPIVWRDGFSLLHWAAQKDKAHLCERLVRLGADPRTPDHSGAKPIDIAQEHRSYDALATLEAIRLGSAQPHDVRF